MSERKRSERTEKGEAAGTVRKGREREGERERKRKKKRRTDTH